MFNKSIKSFKEFLTEQFLLQEKYTKGDVLEAILAVSLTARFLKPNKEFIDLKDVFYIIDSLEHKSKKEYQKQELLEGVFDNIELSVSIPKPSFEAFTTPELRYVFDKQFEQTILFANSPRVSEYINQTDSNSKSDMIIIKSVGTENQKATKVDLQVLIGLNNNKPEITNLNFSIKYQSFILESSSISYKTQLKFWKNFGIDLSKYQDRQSSQTKQEWINGLLQYICGYLNNKILLNDDKEYDFVRTIVEGINEISTKHEEGVDVIFFDDKHYTIYDFSGLYDKLKAFEFECYYSKENKRPLLRIQDKVSKKYILQFRPRYNSKTGDVEKLSIEIGKLLKELLTPVDETNIQLK